jgi:hypothetical protein
MASTLVGLLLVPLSGMVTAVAMESALPPLAVKL